MSINEPAETFTVWDITEPWEKEQGALYEGREIAGNAVSILHIRSNSNLDYYYLVREATELEVRRAEHMFETNTCHCFVIYDNIDPRDMRSYCASLKDAQGWLSDMERNPQYFV